MKENLHVWLRDTIDKAIRTEGLAVRPHVNTRTSSKDICWSVSQKGSGEINSWTSPETFYGEICLSFWALPAYGHRCESLAGSVVSVLTSGTHGIDVEGGLFSVAFSLRKQENLTGNINTVMPQLYAADFCVRCVFYREGEII
ncbi:MAG: hypothetical protein H6849_00175 [Alphaproteobacteria bacterium]|nr:MAG: hypothetical protein H6849_00175 [Alphaproteobacteria bacterium]